MAKEYFGIYLGETSQFTLILSTASSYLKKISEFVPVKRPQIGIILNIHSFTIVEEKWKLLVLTQTFHQYGFQIQIVYPDAT